MFQKIEYRSKNHFRKSPDFLRIVKACPNFRKCAWNSGRHLSVVLQFGSVPEYPYLTPGIFPEKAIRHQCGTRTTYEAQGQFSLLYLTNHCDERGKKGGG
ncbi:hypothetical protein CDAR_465501 [Caerostris darwini]|uniref:Uncharacterized protein n=1 Tax=Caerostris darwini TaxID=1538125 RepID=A0AAV4SC10_9ARAC|nr:hypothetical protein CDAR_465501 [Caerostris darwini]